ncbi:MAG: 16S rRNA (uracil(1498)-N(3))-methyltransferase [Verrucomicrobiota bacterium]
MARFHLPSAQWDSATLEGDEARHLSQVLRLRPGDVITVFDGAGRRAPAEIVSAAKDRISLKIGESVWSPVPRPRITLAQAIPKGKNMDFIVQKAVELGVAAIQPLVTRHTVVQPGDGKADKWRRIALEACKQCGQDALPEVAEPITFSQWLACKPAADLNLIASLAPGAPAFRETLAAHPTVESLTLLIGPEGDFTATETNDAITAGFLPVSLGNIVLRVETAALFCISAVRFFHG